MVTVRAFDADKGDAEAFRTLFRDCLAHYDCGPALPGVEGAILEELTAPFGTFADIAWAGDRPLGFTCWMRVFPAGEGFALYMKELYVARNARGLGVGRALMRRLAERGVDMGALTLRWESGEPGALAFYDKLGMTDDGKTHFTLPADQMPGFAQ
ncbi:MAG: GNAT family N-acetyltransferase [Pseudomonadota bacterium]